MPTAGGDGWKSTAIPPWPGRMSNQMWSLNPITCCDCCFPTSVTRNGRCLKQFLTEMVFFFFLLELKIDKQKQLWTRINSPERKCLAAYSPVFSIYPTAIQGCLAAWHQFSSPQSVQFVNVQRKIIANCYCFFFVLSKCKEHDGAFYWYVIPDLLAILVWIVLLLGTKPNSCNTLRNH